MFNDDDFFINDDELAEDNQLTIVDTARIDLLKTMKKTADDMISNLQFNEKNEAMTNTRLLAGYMDSLIKLAEIELSDNLSDEEVAEEIDKVLKQTTELTFGNINDVLKDEGEATEMPEFEDNDDGDSTDW